MENNTNGSNKELKRGFKKKKGMERKNQWKERIEGKIERKEKRRKEKKKGSMKRRKKIQRN